MKALSLKLPDDLDAKLSAAANRQRTTKSKVARRALEAYLNGGISVEKGTFFELAGDLIGSLQGPGDLSHNPEYLRDFGR